MSQVVGNPEGIIHMSEKSPCRTSDLAFRRSSGRITVLNGPICLLRSFSVSDLNSNRLARLNAFIWSNLCTRHIPDKLTLRGHHDWPDKRATRRMGARRQPLYGMATIRPVN